jgi:molybdopterin/thiamine biosynthesis adenylyltransferase
MFPNFSRLLNQRIEPHLVNEKHQLFRLSSQLDRNELDKLLSENPNLHIHDQVHSQLKDLIKLKNPSRQLIPEEVQELINEELGENKIHEYGTWVFYPWSNKLVHILDEEDFISVRTIRNAYKISFDEQSRLKSKKVGVIGLSVGHSVALTIALERIAGEIRIADFDEIELSNLNRIRTGVHNIGLKKTEIVRREIAEIDPYIKVVLFDSGIDESNISDFLSNNGDIDLLFEECDSIEIKILARIEAKKRCIPVVMDTSDRGMIDVERFDQDRQYPLLHGLINPDLTYAFLKTLKTSEEKLPYILPILGIDSISKRLKASGLEVGKSITTWPQLGSEVTLGGALCVHVGRRILLGETICSGRTWIDIEKEFQIEPKKNINQINFEEELINSKIYEISSKIHLDINSEIDQDSLHEILNAAAAAPSAGNNQKWKWHFLKSNLIIYVDKDKEYAYSDNLNIASLIGIGCCLENIALKSESIGLKADITLCSKELFPAAACVSFSKFDDKRKNNSLAKYIFERRTTRSNTVKYLGDKSKYDHFAALITSPSIKLDFVFDGSKIAKIGALVCKGDRIRFTNRQGHQEFFTREIRWNEVDSKEQKDGLDVTLFDLAPIDIVGLNLSKDIDVIDFINEIGGGKGFERISSKSFSNADSIGFIYTSSFSNNDLIEAGRTIQRIWLKATELGMGIFPMTVLPMLTSFVYSDKHKFNTTKSIKELQEIKKELDDLLKPEADHKFVFMFKVHGVEEKERRSVRHPIQAKLVQ